MRMQEFLVFADLSLDNNVYKSIVLLALTLCTGMLLESLASLPGRSAGDAGFYASRQQIH